MREFTVFPKTGFYVVEEPFSTENMSFLPGAVVALVRWGTTNYVRITMTGERFGGYANYMECEHIPKLRLLTNEEVIGLIAGDFRIEFELLNDLGYLASVCQRVVRPMPVPETH